MFYSEMSEFILVRQIEKKGVQIKIYGTHKTYGSIDKCYFNQNFL